MASVLFEIWTRHAGRRASAVGRALRGALRSVAERKSDCTTPGRIETGLQRFGSRTHLRSRRRTVLRTTEFGDDKDRVLCADGRPTYFANDVAYHYEKLKRSDKVIDILGPDHHGYIGRLKGLAEALGYAATAWTC